MESELQHGEYLIDGTTSRGDDYVAAVKQVFETNETEICHIDRHDGSTLGLANAAPCSVVWFKPDGSSCSIEHFEELNFDKVCEITKTFLHGDDEKLEAFGWDKPTMSNAEAKRFIRALLLLVVIGFALLSVINFLLR